MPLLIKHVFIADDDIDDIFLFESAILEARPDLTISRARDGLSLLDLLNNSALPDAIILDLNMPLMSGKECLVKIRSQRRFDNVPIIMFSTSDRRVDIEYCLSK